MKFTQKEYGSPIEILKFNDFKGEACMVSDSLQIAMERKLLRQAPRTRQMMPPVKGFCFMMWMLHMEKRREPEFLKALLITRNLRKIALLFQRKQSLPCQE